MGREPKLPTPKTFTDGDGWLERMMNPPKPASSKCCTKCRRGTVTHNGGCHDTACACHKTTSKMCTECGRTYSSIDMPFHRKVIHGIEEEPT